MVFLGLDLNKELNNIYFRTIKLEEKQIEKLHYEFPELEEFKNDYNNTINNY
jgi:hypothetical protein